MGMNGGGNGIGMGGAGNLFTLNEESEVDFDSVSDLDRDTLYAPMNYQSQGGNYHVNKNNGNGNYGHHAPKLYTHLNGPPPPPSYMSSSSSNATSNSTSTTSNNTTTQTIATCTTTGITTSANYVNNSTNSSSGVGGSNSSNGSVINQSNFSALVTHQVISNGIVNAERHTNNACQFYYPTPSQPIGGGGEGFMIDNTMSTMSSTSHLQNRQNMNSLCTDTDIDDTIPTQNAQNVSNIYLTVK